MENNISYAEKVCYDISMINLTENKKIKEFKIKIIKIIINLTQNHIEKLYDCELFD